MDLGLSVLDVSPVSAGSGSSRALRNTLDLARHVDGLGYRRYWLAEHHNLRMIASSAPEVMIGHVASVTENVRVGAGGIMLPNHAPLQVVETFKVLEALHPGRIDLGIGRAPGTDPVTASALRRPQAAAGADDFPQQFAELLAYAGDGFPDGHPFRSVAAMPDDVGLPPIWLLGSSGYSARAAGEMGLGYAFAAHFSPTDPAPAIHAYNDGFEPSPAFGSGAPRPSSPSPSSAPRPTGGRASSPRPWNWRGYGCAAEDQDRFPAPKRPRTTPTPPPNTGSPKPTAQCR